MQICEEIETRLRAEFSPELLAVEDDSESHRGHGGWREGGQTHFNVQIRAAVFRDMTRLQRHRAVHAALGPELVGRIHALALDIQG